MTRTGHFMNISGNHMNIPYQNGKLGCIKTFFGLHPRVPLHSAFSLRLIFKRIFLQNRETYKQSLINLHSSRIQEIWSGKKLC